MLAMLAALAVWSADWLLDPLVWIYAIAVGLGSTRWAHVALWSMAAGAAYCLIVMVAVDPPIEGPNFSFQFTIVAMHAATISSLIYLVRRHSVPRLARQSSIRK